LSKDLSNCLLWSIFEINRFMYSFIKRGLDRGIFFSIQKANRLMKHTNSDIVFLIGFKMDVPRARVCVCCGLPVVCYNWETEDSADSLLCKGLWVVKSKMSERYSFSLTTFR